MLTAIAVVINNFLHDLATAVWFSTAVVSSMLLAEIERRGSPELFRFLQEVALRLYRISFVSLGLVFVFGVPRTLAYYRYEYLPAAGRGQVVALVVKHVLLFALVGLGVAWQVRMARRIRRLGVNRND